MLCRVTDLDSTAVDPLVLVLLLEDTGCHIKHDILFFAFVVSLVPFAVGTALVFALLDVFCFRAGACVTTVILTTALRLLLGVAFLLTNVIIACFSSLGDACTCTLRACYMVDPVDLVLAGNAATMP